jgi:phosphoadenosine phosphosulfate reductase
MSMITPKPDEWAKLLAGKTPQEGLQLLSDKWGDRAVFSTSFGMEDQVLTHMIHEAGLHVALITLDTGRLFPETYSVWSRTLERYKLHIRSYAPDMQRLEDLVSAKGPNSFYNSVENRKECCHIRKVEPLTRALAGKAIWVTGLRAEQSENRSGLQVVEWDNARNILKYNPLLNWTWDQVREYVNTHNVPYNALHDKGFPSIGCGPCTRAVKEGEHPRSGRWWWEDNSKQECGIHEG